MLADSKKPIAIFVADRCVDCGAEPYVTARFAIRDSPREGFCRPHAEQHDAKGLFALRSARRVR